MPDIIRIEERSFAGEQFEVRVIFNDQQFPVTVKNSHHPETQMNRANRIIKRHWKFLLNLRIKISL